MTVRPGFAPASHLWANERESAALCDRTYAWFWKNRGKLEAAGFPKRHPLIGKRPVRAIKDFLGRDYASVPAAESEDHSENGGNWG